MERVAEQPEGAGPSRALAVGVTARTRPAGSHPNSEHVIGLQRTIGNRAVVRLLSRAPGQPAGRVLARAAKHVVIDVNDGMADVWSKQFIKFAPSSRARVTMAASAGPPQAIAVIKQAIALAGTSGRVIFNVGHGAALAGSLVDGTVDLSPKAKAVRLGGLNVSDSWINVFYDFDPDGPGPAMSDKENDTRFNPNSRRLKEWAVYQDLCTAFRQASLERVILLTCRVGNAETFIRKIANDWATVVVAFRDRMMLEDVGTTGTRIRMHLVGDSPGSGTNVASSEEQVPLPTDTNSYAAGPPLTASAQQSPGPGSQSPGSSGRSSMEDSPRDGDVAAVPASAPA